MLLTYIISILIEPYFILQPLLLLTIKFINPFPLLKIYSKMSLNSKWNICKYAWWNQGTSKWQVPVKQSSTSPRITLILKGTQLMLVSGKTSMEAFSIIQNKKEASVHLRECCMVIAAKCGATFRKFKILFQTNKEAEDCANELKQYIHTTVVGSDAQEHTVKQNEPNRAEEITLPHLLSMIMSNTSPKLPAPESIPEDYPLESAIRLCILDPGFPKLVEKIESIIKQNE